MEAEGEDLRGYIECRACGATTDYENPSQRLFCSVCGSKRVRVSIPREWLSRMWPEGL